MTGLKLPSQPSLVAYHCLTGSTIRLCRGPTHYGSTALYFTSIIRLQRKVFTKNKRLALPHFERGAFFTRHIQFYILFPLL